jgi:hypothetical protein
MAENIFFLLEEKEKENNNILEINKFIDGNNTLIENNLINNNYCDFYENVYYIELDSYQGDFMTYYNEKYTIKELIKICNYYGISKNIKASKCKKIDIIETIIYYEGCQENYALVNKRHKMWAYIRELLNDPKMKQFVIW